MGISKEERDKRFSRGQLSARKSLAAKEIFSLRLRPETIEAIYEIASTQELHASDLVRGWIENCVSAETQQGKDTASSPEKKLISAVRYAVREEISQIVSELSADKSRKRSTSK